MTLRTLFAGKRTFLFLIFLLTILLSLWVISALRETKEFSQEGTEALPYRKDTDFDFEVVAENLAIPWALAFLPSGNILFNERPGRLSLVSFENGPKVELVASLDEVKHIGEGGLLGLAVHPNFAQNQFIYLYYTYEASANQTFNRIVRFRLKEKSLEEKKLIVDKIPSAPNHNGGRIAFGPDGFLYITTGDAQEPSLAQDKSSLAGKILRVTDEGQPAPNNPFGDLIYSFGHRNAQGLAWDSQIRLWATEHGRSGLLSGLDELNLIEKGKNYGWPIIEGDQQRLGMETPVSHSGPNETWAPAGLAFLPSENSADRGRLFFAGLKGESLYEAKVIQGEVVELRKHFYRKFGRLREVRLGPDNMLYVTTSNRDSRGTTRPGDDKLIRINPSALR